MLLSVAVLDTAEEFLWLFQGVVIEHNEPIATQRAHTILFNSFIRLPGQYNLMSFSGPAVTIGIVYSVRYEMRGNWTKLQKVN